MNPCKQYEVMVFDKSVYHKELDTKTINSPHSKEMWVDFKHTGSSKYTNTNEFYAMVCNK